MFNLLYKVTRNKISSNIYPTQNVWYKRFEETRQKQTETLNERSLLKVTHSSTPQKSAPMPTWSTPATFLMWLICARNNFFILLEVKAIKTGIILLNQLKARYWIMLVISYIKARYWIMLVISYIKDFFPDSKEHEPRTRCVKPIWNYLQHHKH